MQLLLHGNMHIVGIVSSVCKDERLVIPGTHFMEDCIPLFVKYGITTLSSAFVVECLMQVKLNRHLYNCNGDIHSHKARDRDALRTNYLKARRG